VIKIVSVTTESEYYKKKVIKFLFFWKDYFDESHKSIEAFEDRHLARYIIYYRNILRLHNVRLINLAIILLEFVTSMNADKSIGFFLWKHHKY